VLYGGKIDPFVHAEHVVVHPDTLEVTPRWTREDVSFVFR